MQLRGNTHVTLMQHACKLTIITGDESDELLLLLSRHQTARRGSCSLWGRQRHLRNFDGTMITFGAANGGGSCGHTLVRDARGGTFSVAVEEEDCGGSGYGASSGLQCPLRISFFIEDAEYVLKLGMTAKIRQLFPMYQLPDVFSSRKRQARVATGPSPPSPPRLPFRDGV